MSFILDALRKSETERRRNRVPGIAGAAARPAATKRHIWLPLVAILVGLNLGLLALLWYGTSSEPAQAPAPATASPARAWTSQDIQPLLPPPPITDSSLDPSAPRNLADELTPRSQPARAAAAPATAPAPAAVPPASSAATTVVPDYRQALLNGSVTISPLHLDVHVYSQQAAERFVFINTRRYREGERLDEGPTVQEITREGVVLAHQGTRFLLTRD